MFILLSPQFSNWPLLKRYPCQNFYLCFLSLLSELHVISIITFLIRLFTFDIFYAYLKLIVLLSLYSLSATKIRISVCVSCLFLQNYMSCQSYAPWFDFYFWHVWCISQVNLTSIFVHLICNQNICGPESPWTR